jgi:hypothetical protein
VAISAAFVLVAATTCTGSRRSITLTGSSPPTDRIIVHLDLTWMVWDREGSLIVSGLQYMGRGSVGRDRIGRLDLASGRLHLLPELSDPHCDQFEALELASLGLEQLAVMMECHPKGTPPFTRRNTLALLNGTSGAAQSMPGGELTVFDEPVQFTGGFTMDERGAIITALAGRCQTLFRWDETGTHPIELMIGGLRPWSMAEQLESNEPGRCKELGVASTPSLSPDGGRIAFGVQDVAGMRMGLRDFAPWDIYIADRDWTTADLIVRGIDLLGDLAWSPTGEWIAFYGEYGEGRTPGIWLASPTSGNVTLFSRGYVDWSSGYVDRLAWSPEGDRLAAYSPLGLQREQLLLFDNIPSA